VGDVAQQHGFTLRSEERAQTSDPPLLGKPRRC
jgi:hypothetical protein